MSRLVEGIRPGTSEAAALRRYADARISDLHRQLEKPADEHVTNARRGQIIELRRLLSELDGAPAADSDSETGEPSLYG